MVVNVQTIEKTKRIDVVKPIKQTIKVRTNIRNKLKANKLYKNY